MNNESLIFDWLTYDWLNENIEIVIIGLIVSVSILFLFPLLLGYDLKKKEDKKNDKNKLDE